MVTRQDALRELELQIRLNEKLPPELRCDEAIALMKDLLARQRQGPSLKLVQDTPKGAASRGRRHF